MYYGKLIIILVGLFLISCRGTYCKKISLKTEKLVEITGDSTNQDDKIISNSKKLTLAEKKK